MKAAASLIANVEKNALIDEIALHFAARAACGLHADKCGPRCQAAGRCVGEWADVVPNAAAKAAIEAYLAATADSDPAVS